MLHWIFVLLVGSTGWATEEAEHLDHEDHHEHLDHEDHHEHLDPHEDHHHSSDEHSTASDEIEPTVEEPTGEPTGCENLPAEAMQALESHYQAQQQWEARQQEWAEDWGGAVFQLQNDKTRCVSWEEDWVLYAFGGVYSSKAMVERHRWSQGRLVKDGTLFRPLHAQAWAHGHMGCVPSDRHVLS